MISHLRKESKMATTLSKMYHRCIAFTIIESHAVQSKVEQANRKVKFCLRICAAFMTQYIKRPTLYSILTYFKIDLAIFTVFESVKKGVVGVKHKFSYKTSAFASLVNEAGKAERKISLDTSSHRYNFHAFSLAWTIDRVFSSSFFDQVRIKRYYCKNSPSTSQL